MGLRNIVSTDILQLERLVKGDTFYLLDDIITCIKEEGDLSFSKGYFSKENELLGAIHIGYYDNPSSVKEEKLLQEKEGYIINGLFVCEEYRNKGIGKQLIQGVIDFLKLECASNFVLFADIIDPKVEEFYKKQGFNSVDADKCTRFKYFSYLK